jgi:TetR/AcrR family transcriptional regulator
VQILGSGRAARRLECKRLQARRAYARQVATALNTRDTILVVARQRFADRGFSGTSLADIADEVGIRPPSLFHHFPSKVALYRAVLLDAFDDWFALMDETMAAEPGEGWPRVEQVIRTAFRFFVERPDFVRLARREAMEGGPVLVDELATVLRPLFERAVGFLEREMRAGRIRSCDARRLVITGYGAVLSYLSDAPLVGSLLGEDPTGPAALATEQEHIVDLFRHALSPAPPVPDPLAPDPQPASVSAALPSLPAR